MKAHIADVCQSASQNLYALKLLKSHDLDKHTIFTVCQATVLSRLTYASPAWWGFAASDDKLKLQSVLNGATR